ncbi:MAG: GYD domain-containing protein [Planctomycetota bacterium]
MATYIATLKFSTTGASHINETIDRAAAFRADAEKMGISVVGQYWTSGPADGVLIFDAPDETTATAALLHLASKGNVETTTARAYTADEMKAALGKLSG